MAFAYASLADGQLPNAKATLYTAAGQVSIMTITLVETSAAPRTVNLYIKRSGSASKRLIPANTPMDSSSLTEAAQIEAVDRPLELSLGDEIEGDADAAAAIDYSITGATR